MTKSKTKFRKLADGPKPPHGILATNKSRLKKPSITPVVSTVTSQAVAVKQFGTPVVSLAELQHHLDFAEAKLKKAYLDLQAGRELMRDTLDMLKRVRGERKNPIFWSLGHGFMMYGPDYEETGDPIFLGGPTE